MDATTAAPVGAQFESALAPSQGAWGNQLLQQSGQLPQQFYENPNQLASTATTNALNAYYTNQQSNAEVNPGVSGLKQAIQQNVEQNYDQQMASGPGSMANQVQNQFQTNALRAGLGNAFQGGGGTNSSFGQANLQSALGQGVLGANQYIQGMQNQANTTAQNLVAANTGNFAMNPSDLTQFTVGQDAQDVANNNASSQNLLQNEMGQYQNFGNSVNSMAGQLQGVANENAASENQANAANLSFYGGLASDAVKVGGIAAMA